MNKKEFLKTILSLSDKRQIIIFVLGLVMSVITSGINVYIPLLLKRVISQVTIRDQARSIISQGLYIVCLLMLVTIVGVCSSYIFMSTGANIVKSLRNILIHKVVYLPLNYYEKHSQTELSGHIVNDTEVVNDMITDIIPSLISNSVLFLGSLIFLFIINWKGTLVLLGMLPVILVFVIVMGGKISLIAETIQNKVAVFNRIITNILQSPILIKTTNTEKLSERQVNHAVSDIYKRKLNQIKLISIFNPVMSFLLVISIMVVLLYSSIQIESHALSLSSLLTYFMYMFQTITPIAAIGGSLTEIAGIRGATRNIMSLLSIPSEVTMEGINLIKSNVNQLTMKNVSFSYGAKNILHEVNIDACLGQFIAITGPSGAGKTTLFNILEQLYIFKSGDILINKDSIHKYSIASCRQAMALVQQRPELIRGSIKDNIVYGEAFDKEKINQIRSYGILDFIEKLPKKLETNITDIAGLSGGEIQKVAIARALYRESPIILLDEPTSSLDSQSEQEISNIIDKVKSNHIVIMITHRLSSIINADNIYFMEDGYITGKGNHEYLFKNHKLYHSYAVSQMITN